MTQLFTHDDTWLGGYYELALEIDERSDARLLAVLSALWAHSSLTGCYLERDKEPDDQPRIAVTEYALTIAHLQGTARLPNGQLVACGTCLIREEEGSDWLDFYLPMGALGRIYDVGAYPFDCEMRDASGWMDPVNRWLRGIARDVYNQVRFDSG